MKNFPKGGHLQLADSLLLFFAPTVSANWREYHILLNFMLKVHIRIIRSSQRRCSRKKGILRNFTKFTFTGKQLRQSLVFNKVAGLRQFSKNTFLTERLRTVSHGSFSFPLPTTSASFLYIANTYFFLFAHICSWFLLCF